MGRPNTETATFGWLGPPDGTNEMARGVGDLPRSDNWPIPLVVRRQGGGWREISADWFDAAERTLSPSRISDVGEDDGDGYHVVSRRRLRLAHALFVLLALGVIALIAWEVHVYLESGHSLPTLR